MAQEIDFKLVCVVAMAENRVIGDGTDLIWHLPGDLKRVKELTMGCPLIMGRKTYHSIGRALPGRLNIVLTRNPDFEADGVLAAASLEMAVKAGVEWLHQQNAQNDKAEHRLILFGGGEIYRLGLNYCDVIEATIVQDNTHQGVVFPELHTAKWDDETVQKIAAGDNYPAFSYHRLCRKNSSQKKLLDRFIP